MAIGKVMLLGFVAATLGACSMASEMRTATGERELMVRCSPAFLSACTRKAENTCGGPYEMLGLSSDGMFNNMHVRCQS